MHGNYLFRFPPRVLEILDLPRILLPQGYAKEPIVMPNTVVDEGEIEFLRMIARADVSKVASSGNFYMGLCDQIPAEADTLTEITSEPTVTNGYARNAISRDSTGWPTEVVVNGNNGIRSTTEDFAASGGDFSAAISRAFLCNVSSGTAGVLFSYSGALTTAVTIASGETFSAQYEFFIN